MGVVAAAAVAPVRAAMAGPERGGRCADPAPGWWWPSGESGVAIWREESTAGQAGE